MLSKEILLSKLFSTGPAVVVAIDHGLFDGPIAGLEKPRQLPAIIDPEIDAVLQSFGVLSDIGRELYGHRRSPLAIARINWSTIYCFEWDYHSGDSVHVHSPADALRAGAQIVLISLSLKTGSEERDSKNVELFSRLCQQAHDLGMPVIGEYFPVYDEALSENELFEEIKTGCRILYELGADVIKTFYTRDFEQVVAGCPIPILSLGGNRLACDLDALKYAETQINAGAAGIVFGRNVIQSNHPLEIQNALLDVLKRKVSPEEAAKENGLTE